MAGFNVTQKGYNKKDGRMDDRDRREGRMDDRARRAEGCSEYGQSNMKMGGASCQL